MCTLQGKYFSIDGNRRLTGLHPSSQMRAAHLQLRMDSDAAMRRCGDVAMLARLSSSTHPVRADQSAARAEKQIEALDRPTSQGSRTRPPGKYTSPVH